MGGYQFLHIKSFSRKADAEGRTVDFVLAEAARRADACQHVETPAAPDVLFGQPVEDVRILHDARLAEARTTNKDGKSRKLRVDQHTLMTVVLSHPATVAEMRDSTAVAADVQAWEERSVAWLRAIWGETLVSVVRHTDEAHCHLHAFIVPDGPEMRARLLHPGIAAKDREKEAALAEGADAKTANARGDVAYKAALRAMQDDFWCSVGLPSGLARLGPARRRLTRSEWRTEQAAALATAHALQTAEEAKQTAEAAVRDAAMIEEAATARSSAAADLEARARAAAQRASGMVTTAREQAAAAQAAADEAEARRLEAERQARLASTRARTIMEQARAEARRVVGAARQEAAQVVQGARRMGAWFGAVWHGLRGASPAAAARKAAGEARAAERKLVHTCITSVEAEADRLRDRLRATEDRLASISGSTAALSAERDRLARELARLSPPSRPAAPVPTPRLP